VIIKLDEKEIGCDEILRDGGECVEEELLSAFGLSAEVYSKLSRVLKIL